MFNVSITTVQGKNLKFEKCQPKGVRGVVVCATHAGKMTKDN
jgi:hypothetical protein